MTERPSRTRTVILAPSTLQRAAWLALLASQPALELVGAVGDAIQLAALPPDRRVDTVLVDLPQLDAAGVQSLAHSRPAVELLCLVDAYEVPQLIDLIRAGATGCLSRDVSVVDLTRAVVAVGRGELVLPSALAAEVLVTLARGEATAVAPDPALTERERQVIRFLAHGQTNKEIAQALFLSVRTVETHLRNIFAKLAVSSRTEAALWAVRHGFAPD